MIYTGTLHESPISLLITYNSGKNSGYQLKQTYCLKKKLNYKMIRLNERQRPVSLEDAKRKFFQITKIQISLSMIRTMILDDEKHCVESLRLDLVKYCPEVEILATCTGSKEGLQAIKKLKPDLVFLDVEMPWMNGFELLELLQPVEFDVIFTTAYDSYALKAFRVSAVDYLLKPICKDDLISAVQRIHKKLNDTGTDRIQTLLDDYFTRQQQSRITIPEKDGYQFIDVPNILYAESDGNYARIFIHQKSPLFVSMTLKDLENKLSGNNFCRVHHSFLVNLDNVDRYVKAEGGYLVMKNGAIVPVSRAKKNDLKSVIQV